MLSLPEELNKMNLSKIPGSQNNSINLQLLSKFCSLVHFDSFPHKHGSFALSVDVFKKILLKPESPNVYEM